MLFECGPLPPYIHLAFIRHHPCDRCSQAFPIFLLVIPLLHIILNANQRMKYGGGYSQRVWEIPVLASRFVSCVVLVRTALATTWHYITYVTHWAKIWHFPAFYENWDKTGNRYIDVILCGSENMEVISCLVLQLRSEMHRGCRTQPFEKT